MVETMELRGHGGIRLMADVAGPAEGKAVVLLHGGGQTRGSWKNGLSALAERGYRVFSLDSRGHGESDWAPDEEYGMEALAADLRAVLTQIPAAPALVGASMGGVTAMTLLGGDNPPEARALVLVDVTPKIDMNGAQRIGDFMRANPGGFATLEEAADAVSAYNPHRPRPKDISGLQRNLREVEGRLYWHWDPAFVSGRRFEPDVYQARLEAAARRIEVPTLLVRGSESEIVGAAEVEHFRQVMPSAEFVDVAGAGHMVAGDRNDAFNRAIIDFLAEVDAAG